MTTEKFGRVSSTPFSTNVLPTRLVDDVGTTAICFFFANHVLDTEVAGPSAYEFFTNIYERAGDDSALHHAVSALGFAGLASHCGASSSLSVRASTQYQQAISSLNDALQDRNEVKSDATLLSVCLLGLFEV